MQWETSETSLNQCCPIDSLHCAGCMHQDGNNYCDKCTGGYTLDTASGEASGKCTICADTANWLNEQGDPCSSSIHCNDLNANGLSSNDACCVCKGGHRAATPFMFPQVNLLLGEDVPTGSKQLGPIPRTAEKYTASHDCKLGDYGIQIDDVTGVLRNMPKVSVGGPAAEPFEVICDLTAHQEPGLNATAVIS